MNYISNEKIKYFYGFNFHLQFIILLIRKLTLNDSIAFQLCKCHFLNTCKFGMWVAGMQGLLLPSSVSLSPTAVSTS